MKNAATRAAAASATMAPASTGRPQSCKTRKPPNMVPSRIVTNVPSSISALPAINSSRFRYCGSTPYLIGPKKAAVVPAKNSTTRCMKGFCSHRLAAPNTMAARSNSLIQRASVALSCLSASCPAMAENRKYGSMKSARPACTKRPASQPCFTARSKVMRMAMPLRRPLSLKAPMACVTNSGRKLRDFSSANWLLVSEDSTLMGAVSLSPGRLGWSRNQMCQTCSGSPNHEKPIVNRH